MSLAAAKTSAKRDSTKKSRPLVGDPMDRVLVAQAGVEGIGVVPELGVGRVVPQWPAGKVVDHGHRRRLHRLEWHRHPRTPDRRGPSPRLPARLSSKEDSKVIDHAAR